MSDYPLPATVVKPMPAFIVKLPNGDVVYVYR